MGKKLIKIIRDGMTMSMPIILVGSFVAVILYFPNSAWQNILQNFLFGSLKMILEIVYKATFGIYSIILTCMIAYNFAITFKKELPYSPTISIIVAMTALVTSCMDFSNTSNINLEMIGIEGTCTAVILTLAVLMLFKSTYKIKWARLEKTIYGVNTILKDSISFIIPFCMTLFTVTLLNSLVIKIFNIDNLFYALNKMPLKFLQAFPDNGISLILLLIAVHLLSIVGVRVFSQIFVCGLLNISTAYGLGIFVADGMNSQQIITYISTFLFMGGCGGVICLNIGLLLFSKRQNIRNLSKISFTASLFNINDILMFGMPIVFNTSFIIPFVCVPLMFLLNTYIAMYMGLVPMVSHYVHWTTPPVINGYLATGSINASILQIINIIIGIFMYKPFIIKNDVKEENAIKETIGLLEKELHKCEEVGDISNFIIKNNGEAYEMANRLYKDLEYAIDHNEIELFYQPQVRKDGKCIGAEALLRWKHKTAGYIYPPLVIALAKESGLLLKLEKCIFDIACRDLKYLHDNVSKDIKISVNITGSSLMNEKLNTVISQAVEKYDVNPEKLWIEITEQDAISLTKEVTDRLMDLKNKGHKLLIDDFGMGHTSILYLESNNFDIVKLDGSLTIDVLVNEKKCKIISSLAYLADSMNIKIIAEYVENDEQKQKLKELRCDAFQGYLYSKPLRLEEFVQWYNELESHEQEQTDNLCTYKDLQIIENTL